MMLAFEWMVAARYLRSRRQEGFISVIAWFSLLGITLGVGTLIVVMAVMNGFREEILSRILGLNGHLSVLASAEGMADFDALTAAVARVPGVVAATPMIQGQVMASANGVSQGAVVRGIRTADLDGRDILKNGIVAGSLSALDGTPTVMVGSRLAEQLGLTVGDRVTLISPQGRITAFGTIPRVKTYDVGAIFQVGMFEYDSSFLFMALDTAQTYFQLPERATAIEVFAEDADLAPRIGRDVAAAVGGGYRVYDWQQANSSLVNALKVERNVMFFILTLIILVAAFNIISSLIMLVKDKGRDVAILRTMGATRGMIMRVFFIAGASVGVIGTLLGFVLGLTFAQNIETFRQWIQALTGTELFAAEIYFLSRLPAKTDPVEVAAVVAMALVLCFLATLYPSWRAARIEPAEALRYE